MFTGTFGYAKATDKAKAKKAKKIKANKEFKSLIKSIHNKVEQWLTKNLLNIFLLLKG